MKNEFKIISAGKPIILDSRTKVIEINLSKDYWIRKVVLLKLGR